MQTVTVLESWSDDRGNRIEVAEGARCSGRFQVVFHGSNNVLRIGARPRIGSLRVHFDCDNGTMVLQRGTGLVAATVRVGQDSTVKIGRGTTTTEAVALSAVEGTKLVVGRDVMIATGVQIRTDDGHPIFDVRTGQRVNVSRDIRIGNHVWLGWGSTILGGTEIGDGSVVGFGAVAKKKFPNNVVVAGVPARVVRRDIAWERPHLSMVEPFYKPDASTVRTNEEWWNLTEALPAPAAPLPRGLRGLAGRALRRLSLPGLLRR